MSEAPYAADVRAKGWRFELDHERIRQSDTWALAAPEVRPWLLMLWMVAWEQAPCGSLPKDGALVSARIGMPQRTFEKHREVLMRGWIEADDGRLYHQTLTERVLEMVAYRRKEAERRAGNRSKARDSTVSPEVVPRDNAQTVPRDSTPAPDTGTGTRRDKEQENPPASRVPLAKAKGSKRCPAEFAPASDLLEAMRQECPRVDVDAELRTLRDHEFAKARSDWPAVFRNWVREAAKRLPPAKSAHVVETSWQRSQRERVAQMTGGLVSAKPPSGAHTELEFVDVESVARRLG